MDDETKPLVPPKGEGRTTINSYAGRFNLRLSKTDEWEYPEIGTVKTLDLSPQEDMVGPVQYSDEEESGKPKEEQKKNPHLLGQFRATAIAGNDITSSIFYTVGVSTAAAGKYVPISMTLVVAVLFLFRSIYSEVCTALPLNGGTYNVLLNTTTKGVAALAAALSLLSYLATAVVSAFTAACYAEVLVEPTTISAHQFVFWVTIGILGIFALLNLLGLSESANVALVIFIGHLSTLALLVAFSLVNLAQKGPEVLIDNWQNTAPDNSWPLAIFFGFSTALLGVSGFESSSNYIEEQKDGVFAKTLRNMWICIMIFNPMLSFLSIATLDMSTIASSGDCPVVLADMARRTPGGRVLATWIGVDAVIVLSGAVLTSYVGITGLVRRMCMDRCLPEFLLAVNPWRKTNHWIIIGFFLLTASLMFITNGSVQILAGVYTVAFLSVMSLFAIGNVIMKYKRKRLPREVHASWITVFVGLACVIAGLIGNITFDPTIVLYFFIYFVSTMLIIFVMFTRIRILKIFLYFLKDSFLHKYCGEWAARQGKLIKNQPMVFFAKTSDLHLLNKAILYVLENEITDNLKIVHVFQEESQIPHDMQHNVQMLDKTYPKLRLDLILVKGKFNPSIITKISKALDIPKNLMFITCPTEQFQHKIADFGGLRVITH